MGAQSQDSWLLEAQPKIGLLHEAVTTSTFNPPAHRETHRVDLDHYLAIGEGRTIDELTAIRKGGEAFLVELTVCPVMVAGGQLFCGLLRDLSERGRSETASQSPDASGQA